MTSPRQRKMQEATAKLAKYFNVSTFDQYFGNVNQQSTSSPQPILDYIGANFINSSAGATFTHKLVQKINEQLENSPEAQERFNRSFKIYTTNTTGIQGTTRTKEPPTNEAEKNRWRPPLQDILFTGDEKLSENSNSPSNENSNVSVFVVNSPQVGLANRDVDSVTLFLNGVPNLELNKAVPFVDVRFILPRSSVNSVDNRIQGLSLSKFLLGEQKIDDGDSTLNTIVRAQPPDLQDAASVAGMELFTSPQTLVNADLDNNDESLRATAVLDKFRPLMTLQSLDVTVQPSKGLMSYKTANLSFVLHDRSRMSEIAEFIRADLYGKLDLLIEYGWSTSSESTGDNPNAYADLINGMRVKEKYMIYNSSFTFNESNQVIITLKLAMRGAVDFDTELISSDATSVGSVIKEIEEIQKTVGEYAKKINKYSDVVRTKEVRGHQILDSAQDIRTFYTTGADFKKELKEFKKKLGSSTPNAKKLIVELEKLQKTFDEGDKKNVRRSIVQSIKDKISNINKSHVDPWLQTNYEERKTKKTVAAEKGDLAAFNKLMKPFALPKSASKTISLAKLLLYFVIDPLAKTEKYAEVQLIFYPFNNSAGFARNLNIAEFAVDLRFFQERYFNFRTNNVSKSGNLTLKEFLRFVSDVLLDDAAAPSYGIGSLFKDVVSDKGEGHSTEPIDNPSGFAKKMEEVMKKAGTPDNSWKPPSVDFYIEALPEAIGDDDGISASQISEKTILRIHVFDQQHTKYETIGRLLASTRDAEIAAIQNNLQKAESAVVEENEAVASAQLKEAEDGYGLIEKITGENYTSYKIKGTPRGLKEFIKSTVPYIEFGSAGSVLKAANLSSIQDSKLSTVNMLRSYQKDDTQAENEDPGGLPMRIIPTQLNVTTLGCPLINFAQQFFVDFHTGTTADAIYSVVGLTHKLTPGEFSSEIKFTPGDGWGQYITLVQRMNSIKDKLNDLQTQAESPED